MDVNELIKRLENIPDKSLQVKILDSYQLTENDNYEYVDIGKVYTESEYGYVDTDKFKITKFIVIEEE